MAGGMPALRLGAEFPEDLAQHPLEESGVGGIEVEAVDQASDFALVEFRSSPGEVAAGAQRVQEGAGKALKVGRGGRRWRSLGESRGLRRLGVIAGDFIEADGDGLAEVHGGMFFARRDVREPVAVAQIVVRKADFFRSKQQRDALGAEGFAHDARCGFEAMHGVLGEAVAKGGGADDERAVSDGFSEGGELFGALQHLGRTDRGAGFAESDLVRPDNAKVEEPEVAHGSGGGAEVERVAGADEHQAEVVGGREQEDIVRRGRPVAREGKSPASANCAGGRVPAAVHCPQLSAKSRFLLRSLRTRARVTTEVRGP